MLAVFEKLRCAWAHPAYIVRTPEHTSNLENNFFLVIF